MYRICSYTSKYYNLENYLKHHLDDLRFEIGVGSNLQANSRLRFPELDEATVFTQSWLFNREIPNLILEAVIKPRSPKYLNWLLFTMDMSKLKLEVQKCDLGSWFLK